MSVITPTFKIESLNFTEVIQDIAKHAYDRLCQEICSYKIVLCRDTRLVLFRDFQIGIESEGNGSDKNF